MARRGPGAGGAGAGAGADGGAPVAEMSRLSTDVKASIATWLRKRGKAVRPEMSRSQREEIKVTPSSPPTPLLPRPRRSPAPAPAPAARSCPRPGGARPSSSTRRASVPPRSGRPLRGPARTFPPAVVDAPTCHRMHAPLGAVERAGEGDAGPGRL